MTVTNATERFSDRVENYIKYRPGYPQALVDGLIQQAGLKTDSVIADIGSGTGIFTQALLEKDFNVYAVEPNAPMREAAEHLLQGHVGFNSIAASAEDTVLADHSIDLITAAQAFHWFNNDTTRNEFRRILKAEGQLALIWNQRNQDQLFQQRYDAVLREFAPDYGSVNHMNLNDDEISGFFATGTMKRFDFENFQSLDFDSLLGRLRSASYCPAEDSSEYQALANALSLEFEREASSGVLRFEYQTHLYLGAIQA